MIPERYRIAGLDAERADLWVKGRVKAWEVT